MNRTLHLKKDGVVNVVGAPRADKKGSASTILSSKGATSQENLTLPIDELLSRLKTSRSGITSQEAKSRLEIYGYNEIAKQKKRTKAVEFLLHFRSPLVIILLVAGSISGFTSDMVDATIIFTIVFMSVVLDFYQESKAEAAAEALKEKVPTTATVLRDGAKREVGLPEVVPGDIVYLSAGDIVPADARLIDSKDLFADQSTLTGESFPVEKKSETLESGDQVITEWDNFLFLGTSVVSGTATAVVVRTGGLTEFGKIAKKLTALEPETEFERGLRRFGYLIMQVTFALVIFVFFVNVLYKHDVLDSLLFAVALAVGLTPELLPMIISINLSKGALEMSRKGVIVKRLASIQNFGSMDILCSDKTGTLTENRVTLISHIDVNGNEDDKVLIYAFLNSHFETGLESPLDQAILEHKEVDITAYEKIDEVPFDFVRRRVSVVIQNGGKRLMITKGAPEEVLRVSTRYETTGIVYDCTNELLQSVLQRYKELSNQGFRVLGVSYKEITDERTNFTIGDEVDLIFMGFLVFLDPPKESARETLQLLKRSGIELKVITGDSDTVTRKVCEELGFEIKGIVLGRDIARLQDDALARVVEEANIFARVTPAQKDRIIDVLKHNGHVVGFLGDGINDASSMKIADVSMSVENAVDVAKESADIILLQKSLRVLLDGVLEGRKTFGNTMKYVMMGVSSNFGNMFSVAGASLFLPFLPMLPKQILLNNLLYDLSETTVPTDNVDPEYIQRPRRWNVKFVRKFMLLFGPISSIFDFLTFFIMLYVFNATESLFQTAWFLESLATQTLVIFVIRTRRTPFYKSRPSKSLLFSSLAVVGIALILPFTPLSAPFEFIMPPLRLFAFLGGLIVIYLILVEAAKRRFYRNSA